MVGFVLFACLLVSETVAGFSAVTLRAGHGRVFSNTFFRGHWKESLIPSLPSCVLWFYASLLALIFHFWPELTCCIIAFCGGKDDILWMYWMRIENSEIMMSAQGKILKPLRRVFSNDPLLLSIPLSYFSGSSVPDSISPCSLPVPKLRLTSERPT